MTSKFQTCIRRVPAAKGRCYGCGKAGRYCWYDPESNGLLCPECATGFIKAEYVLLATPGIERPCTPTTKPKKH